MTMFEIFTNTVISDPFFTRLRALSTDFVLIQVNIGSDTLIFNLQNPLWHLTL